MVSEGDDDRFFLDRQHRRLRILRPGRQIGNRAPLLPLCDRLLVDPVALGEPPQALLTMLYRSTDRRCRRGAAVKNLSHSASFHSVEKTAPSKPGIKQLALQLSFCLEVCALSDRLVSSAPERPCDDVGALDALSSEPDGDAPNFLD